MLLKSDAYDACISYFADNLDIFEGQKGSDKGELISDIVSDQVADMLLCFCQQQPQLSNKTRLVVIAEGDKLVEDIEQILGSLWDKPASASQIEFIEEYFLLLKNSLDSQVPVNV
ncbi:DUF3802 family protein [Psychromonas aquimarina]|uniref:DUF3802 family protein n=1 Tax=Psychromonas aquimarina TaxID=444919 RepID=UPI0003F9A59C|nr:DUF3802 family protein [Psychromonas aquimarina]